MEGGKSVQGSNYWGVVGRPADRGRGGVHSQYTWSVGGGGYTASAHGQCTRAGHTVRAER